MTFRLMLVRLSCLCWIVLAFTPALAEDRPNILLILADDMTYRDCGAYGSTVVQTPHIDRLANEGMRFECMFTSTAMCSPTRQQLYTGIWPVRNGAYPNHSRVYDGTKSWVHQFRKLGYRCGLAGKNHCKPRDSFPWEEVGSDKEWGLDEIREFIIRNADAPYFLVAAHRDPHTPWSHGDASAYPPDSFDVPPYLVDTPTTRDALSHYYAEITYLDSQIGDVLQMVDDSGQREHTIVIFTSEQGSSLPFGKWTCYENGLHTGFIVRWPARVRAGLINNVLCQYVDVLPTLLDAIGVDPTAFDTGRPGDAHGGHSFDGRSFLPVLLGESQHHRDYVFGIHTSRGIKNGTDYPIRSVRGERYKYIRNLNHENAFTNNVTERRGERREDGLFDTWLTAGREATARSNFYQHRPAEELYDLEVDPFELHNIAGSPQHTAIQQQLAQVLARWMKQQNDQGIETERQANERQPQRKKS